MTRPFGATGLTVTPVSAGLAAWRTASFFGPGSAIEDNLALGRALATEPRVALWDTSNNYGDGSSERRLGALLDELGGVPAGVVLSTKADRRGEDFTGERVRRSLVESAARLGVEHFPLLWLHDPENTTWAAATGAGGPVEALVAARDEGLIGALGISGGPCDMLAEYLRLGVFDAVISHNRYTLVDRSADALLDLAAGLGVGVLNAAPYGGGILTAHPAPTTRYAYDQALPAQLDAVARIGELVTAHGASMAAVALQFSLRDPRIHSTVIGMRTTADLAATLALADEPVPEAVWAEIDAVALDPATFQDARFPWRDPTRP